MIIRIPIYTEDLGVLAELGLEQIHYGLLNTDDMAYTLPQDDKTIIFLKSGMLTDEDVELGLTHCYIQTPLTADELLAEIRQSFLTQN